ncbi:hypothetical protein [Natronorubrum aibiense]|uniref:SRPBCC family protein n=1 Tax=Natronorubrum aibiense TaxID=348826 RepID=A0A5P9P350_9EURY|nr:hypothetical protein [Natronorubrum aibiense]QFU82564.1 hypothetical protein GCU68_08540 [Natronorubrum aibiense]
MLAPLVKTLNRRRGDHDALRVDDSLLIDQYLPTYDATQRRHTVVDAAPETTYDAMLEADMMDTGPVVRGLSRLRDLPARLERLIRGTEPAQFPDELTIERLGESDEWVLIDERAHEELVFGTVGTFWKPSIEWLEIDPDDFATFDDPGYAKLAVSLSVRPYGEHRTLLTYEARTATTDDESRRQFERYWRVIGPFAGYLMQRALDRIRTDAEDRARDRDTTRPRSATDDAAGTASGDGNAARTPVSVPRRRWPWLLAALSIGGAYHTRVRPWHRRWGTTPREAVGALPGDEFVDEPANQVTHAIEIDAAPDAAWQWLVQIGQNRGGFYSYDFLENLFGADIHTVDRIVPEYQTLEEGDVVRLAPADSPISTPESAPEVVYLETQRAIVLRPPIDGPTWTWAFVLQEPEEEKTRLVARMRSPTSSGLEAAVDYLFWEPAHFVMERRMLRELKRRAEVSESARSAVETDAA